MTKTLVGTPDPDDSSREKLEAQAYEAVEVLKGLLGSANDDVRLRAAREILDRTKIKAGEYVISTSAGTATAAASNVTLSSNTWRHLNDMHASAEPEEVSPRASVLREAEGLITGDRNVSYGSPTQNFANIAEMWTTRLRHKLLPGEAITASEVGELQILLKVARNIAQPKRDNFTDLAGYAGCAYEAFLEQGE